MLGWVGVVIYVAAHNAHAKYRGHDYLSTHARRHPFITGAGLAWVTWHWYAPLVKARRHPG